MSLSMYIFIALPLALFCDCMKKPVAGNDNLHLSAHVKMGDALGGGPDGAGGRG